VSDASNDTPTNSVDALRAELFGALRDLRAGKIDVQVAKGVSDIAQTIINSAKVEVDYLRANGGGDSNFLDAATTAGKLLPPGITGSRVHRIKG